MNPLFYPLIDRNKNNFIFERLIGWLIDCSIDWSFGWSVDWSIDYVVDWLIVRSIDCLIILLVVQSIDWLLDSINSSFGNSFSSGLPKISSSGETSRRPAIKTAECWRSCVCAMASHWLSRWRRQGKWVVLEILSFTLLGLIDFPPCPCGATEWIIGVFFI